MTVDEKVDDDSETTSCEQCLNIRGRRCVLDSVCNRLAAIYHEIITYVIGLVFLRYINLTAIPSFNRHRVSNSPENNVRTK